VGDNKPGEDHPTGVTHRDQLKLDWSHGHNNTIHNGIGRIGFYTGGHAARFRDEDLADEWVKQSVKWMEDNKEKPFFLFFAAHDIHVPRMPHERFQGKSSMGLRGDSILQFDWCVGELMKTVERLKISDNTLIVLCSDNGPVLDDGYKDGAVEKLGNHKPAGPWSGGKYSVQEGGTRTPFITHWPGRIKPGVSDEVVSTIDLPASFAALTGVALPKEAALDSFNVMQALLGTAGAKGRDHLVQQDNGNAGNFGLRVGNWKLQAKRFDKKNRGPVTLFDLANDPGEKNDLSKMQPEVVQRLAEQLQKIIDQSRSRSE
jgi:arylsulfatase A